jgi:CheY-like chemotaxis protein
MSDQTVRTRVLVVDDDEVSREVLVLLLEDKGYVVSSADSGDAALVQLKAGEVLPEVALVDMQMPGTVGSSLASQLREVCGAETMLVAMSGNQPGDEARRGFDGFLLKPFTMEQFATAMHGTLPVVREGKDETADCLNEHVYLKLSRSMQKTKMEQLYAMCLGDAERRIAVMRQAASEGDDDAYKKQAHAIKGGCGMVGATELQSIATTMETHGIRANHVASLDEFLLACERLRRILIEREE